MFLAISAKKFCDAERWNSGLYFFQTSTFYPEKLHAQVLANSANSAQWWRPGWKKMGRD